MMRYLDELISTLKAVSIQMKDGAELGFEDGMKLLLSLFFTKKREERTACFIGNGGSAADAEHLVGELQKGFCLKRPLDEAERKRLVSFDSVDGQYLADRLQGGLPAVSLVSQIALGSAVANDQGGDLALAQSLSALGRRDDVFLGISTSGNARNVALASLVAHCRDMHVIGLTGRDGGWLAKQAEVCIAVPEDETYRVQELHLPVYHALCMMVEDFFFQNP